jgi:hypothetical protein
MQCALIRTLTIKLKFACGEEGDVAFGSGLAPAVIILAVYTKAIKKN